MAGEITATANPSVPKEAHADSSRLRVPLQNRRTRLGASVAHTEDHDDYGWCQEGQHRRIYAAIAPMPSAAGSNVLPVGSRA